MAIRTPAELKEFFETGDFPTQQQFADLIDSMQPIGGTVTLKTINSESLIGNTDILLQTPLVSGTDIKTIDGSTLLSSGNISTYGKCFIRNSSGSPTFYSSLSSAISASSSGDTIGLMTNISENITLKDGVNINGNGYTLTGTGSTNCVSMSGTVNCGLYNLTIVLNSATYSSIRISNSSTINTSGCIFKNTLLSAIHCESGSTINNGICYGSAVNFGIMNNVKSYYIDGNGTSASIQNSGQLNYCQGIVQTSSIVKIGIYLKAGSNVSFCYGKSIDGAGIYSDVDSTIIVNNCIGISDSAIGLFSGGTANNSSGYSNVYIGMNIYGGNNNYGYSNTNYGLVVFGNTSNSIGESSSFPGIGVYGTTSYVNCCKAISTSTYGCFVSIDDVIFDGCQFISTGGSSALRIDQATINNVFINCYFKATGGTSYSFYSTNPTPVVKTKCNKYHTTNINTANITVDIGVSTADSSGNIIIDF